MRTWLRSFSDSSFLSRCSRGSHDSSNSLAAFSARSHDRVFALIRRFFPLSASYTNSVFGQRHLRHSAPLFLSLHFEEWRTITFTVRVIAGFMGRRPPHPAYSLCQIYAKSFLSNTMLFVINKIDCIELVDVVLLPVQRGIGLDDDVLVRGLLELVDEHGLAGLQRFGDFGINANRKVRAFVIGRGHLARFSLDFVAERGDGLDHAGAGAVRARLAEDALERLLGALAGDADKTELVEGKRF